MKEQPAKVNYFFKGAYVELGRTISMSFTKLGNNISSAASDVSLNWVLFWNEFVITLGGVFGNGNFWECFSAIGHAFLCGFSIAKLICVLIITSLLTIVFSAIHVAIVIPIMTAAYVLFFIAWLFDTLYLTIKGINSHCPNCQNRFVLPTYECPKCHALHDTLRPSKYGIWKRTCECGERIPTTFFNGRQHLKAYCPHCGHIVEDGGQHVEICIPVVGGTSTGKTCFINMAINQVEIRAEANGLVFRYLPSATDDYAQCMDALNHCRLPDKTYDMRLKYYQFYLTPKQAKLLTKVDICDVGGEVYSQGHAMEEQIGYRHANGFLLLIDPLAIEEFRRETSGRINISSYGSSTDSLDSVLSTLITTLSNMFSMKTSEMQKIHVAAVITKCDIPGLYDRLCGDGMAKYMQANPNTDKYDAQNAVCEQFLLNYGEYNFVNSLKAHFKSVQFFCASALGHSPNGTPFKPQGVEDPLLWLIDKTNVSIDLSDKWGKKT